MLIVSVFGQPFNITAAVLFVAAGAGLYFYFTYEKERMARKRIAEQTKGIGKPKVGGPFDLIDHNGNRFTSEDMKGKYALVRHPSGQPSSPRVV
jgi:protein SCO1/2